MATDVNLSNDNVITGNVTSNGVVSSTIFSGDGSQLTNINASTLNTTATLALLSADNTVNDTALFFQKNIFPSSSAALTINNGGFDCSTSGVVVPESGVYIVGANARFSSTVSRTAVAMTFTVNSLLLNPEFQSVASYIRDASDHNDSSTPLTGVLELVSGDEVGLAFAQYGNTGTVSLVSAAGLESSHFFMYRIS